MAFDGTYTGLQASIAGWLHRTDLAAIIPDLIVLAEARISRDLRLRRQVTTTAVATVAGVQSITLPTDYLEVENLSLLTAIERQLVYMNIEQLNERFPSGGGNGTPIVYTLEGDTILFGPTPDSIYSVSLLYYARFAALATTATNWLLTNHPNIYLFAALAEAGDYLQSEQAGKWEAKYQQGVKQLQDMDDQSMFSGSALRVRSL